MLLSVIMFLAIGEIVMPQENPTGSGNCVLFEMPSIFMGLLSCVLLMIKNEKKVLMKLRDERNEHAFDLIYNEYYKLVYYVIFKIVGDHEVARDLSIDTFLTMYNKIEQHDMNKSFKYWLLTIAKNNGKLYSTLLHKNKSKFNNFRTCKLC